MKLPGDKQFTNELQGWFVPAKLGQEVGKDNPLVVRGSIVQTSADIAPTRSAADVHDRVLHPGATAIVESANGGKQRSRPAEFIGRALGADAVHFTPRPTR